APGELVHLAAVYSADNRIALYRNGAAYGTAYTPAGDATLRNYPAADARVLIGKRHTGGGNAFFAGDVAEARLYDRALTAGEGAASFRAGPGKARPDTLTPEQRRQRDEILRELTPLRESLRARTQTQAMAWAAVSSTPGPTHVLVRGEVEKPGERVGAAGLSAVRA